MRCSTFKGRPDLCFEPDKGDTVSTEGTRLYLERASIRKRATAVLRMTKWTRSKRMATILSVDDGVDYWGVEEAYKV